MPAADIAAVSPDREVEATTNIPAPIAGVVTGRDANAGLNVDTATKLFTVVDLSSVWVVGALYERDFSRVHVGTSVTVTTTAYPGVEVHGRVSYIDPQVSAETRTARARVEVPNPRQELRLGMYADIEIDAMSSRHTVMIPRSAVQNVDVRQVVYLASTDEPGKFTERQVRLGATSGDQVEVIAGVEPGDQIVSKGSFFVRAERERLGLRPATSPRPPGRRHPGPTEGAQNDAGQTTRITVGERGYEPSRVTLRPGVPTHLTFIRTTDKTCGTAVGVSEPQHPSRAAVESASRHRAHDAEDRHHRVRVRDEHAARYGGGSVSEHANDSAKSDPVLPAGCATIVPRQAFRLVDSQLWYISW
jgi:hypothetical protein